MSRARDRSEGLLTRRALLAGAAFIPSAISACTRSHVVDGDSGAGPSADASTSLVLDPDEILDLPEGFSYQIVQQLGEPMSDGYRVPGRPDGMYCVEGDDGALVLLRNHENREGYPDFGPYLPEQSTPEEAYDPTSLGGVTRVVLDPKTLAVRSSNLVLTGTSWNCASGPSPWGFLTCEENTREGHGFVFLCEWGAESVQLPRRIEGYGRFRHEAAAVDPETMIAYLTEDQPNAGFYRFVPHRKDEPFEGVLQALAVRGRPMIDTGMLPVGERVDVEWIDIEEPVPGSDNVRVEALGKGAARFQRTEGIYFAGHEVFLCATTGGPIALGQVLRLDVREQTLETVVATGTPDLMSGPDNVCVSPHGVLYVAEDGVGDRHLRRISLDGEVLPFARNARSQTELGGLCFSPRGDTLFVNIQEEGLTLAVRGPFGGADAELARGVKKRRRPHDGLAVMARAAWRNRVVG
jgi:secreted PhoX family phosphatase